MRAMTALKYFPTPFEFREPKTDSDTAMIVDAKGFAVAYLFWPTHPAEETEAAEQETYALGRAMADVASPAVVREEEMPEYVVSGIAEAKDYANGCTSPHADCFVIGWLAARNAQLERERAKDQAHFDDMLSQSEVAHMAQIRELTATVDEAVRKEREECARICDEYYGGIPQFLAKSIRARSEVPPPSPREEAHG